MTDSISCPVPAEQRPLEEFHQLSRSWFFSWPTKSVPHLLGRLITSWLLMLPLSTLIASGSWILRNDPIRMTTAGSVSALVLPLFLLLRQWLGWTYIMKRLLAKSVDYEESGWYDGQCWEKPISWRNKDLLIARHEVRPILGRISSAIAAATLLMLLGAIICKAL